MDFETLQTVAYLEKAKQIALKAMEPGISSRYYQMTEQQYFHELGSRVMEFPGIVSHKVSRSRLSHSATYYFTQTEGLTADLQAVKEIDGTGFSALSRLAIKWSLLGADLAIETVDATRLLVQHREMQCFETSLSMLDDLIKQNQVTFHGPDSFEE